MLKNEKRDLVGSLKEELQSSNVVLVLEHASLPFSSFDAARRNATENTTIKKIKNNLAKIAFEGTNYEALNEHLEKERLLILSSDLFEACKSARFFLDNNKKNPVKVLKGATADEVYDAQSLIELASVNSIQELQSNLLRVIKVVGENILRVIKAKYDETTE